MLVANSPLAHGYFLTNKRTIYVDMKTDIIYLLYKNESEYRYVAHCADGNPVYAIGGV